MENSVNSSKGLNITLWVAQIVLAIVFTFAGFQKLHTPIDELAKMLPWVASAPETLVRLIGVIELLGVVVLIALAPLGMKPNLVPWAALGLAMIMISSIIFHIWRGEASVIGWNVVLALIAGFVYWGRKKVPIPPINFSLL